MIAALFPGQGSQVVGMARAFYDSSPAAKRVLDEAEAALPGLLELMFEGPEDKLTLTANQQPALVAASAAAFAAYVEAGGEAPAYVAGHSLGEFSAHVAAGSLSLSDAVQLVHKRGQYMQDAVPEGAGAMAAVMKLDAQEIEKVCQETEGVVEIANYNSPGQTVISGAAEALRKASETLKEKRARVIPLKVSAPFHCSLMQPAADKLAADLRAITFNEPQFKLIPNVTAQVLGDAGEILGLLESQVTASVRWTETVLKLHDLGVTKFIEFGSGKVLTGLVGRILDKPEALAVTDKESLEAAL